MSRDLGDVGLAALTLDGIELKGRCCVVALGVSTEAVKIRTGSDDEPSDRGRTPQRDSAFGLWLADIGRKLDGLLR